TCCRRSSTAASASSRSKASTRRRAAERTCIRPARSAARASRSSTTRDARTSGSTGKSTPRTRRIHVLFTCPGNVARGGERRRARGQRRHLCVDVHCHVHYLPADDMVKHAYSPDREPAARFANELTRLTNGKQMENVRVCLTSVEQRLRDMDKMGVDVQAISCSPFQFKYSLDPE